jgi:hypothetical protein
MGSVLCSWAFACVKMMGEGEMMYRPGCLVNKKKKREFCFKFKLKLYKIITVSYEIRFGRIW